MTSTLGSLSGLPAAIGGTPLVQLSRVFEELNFRVFAKLEMLNPGGSSKDRPALSIIRQALEDGLIGEGSTIIESTSGNMGIGLAQVCCYYGLRLICVVDPKATPQNVKLLRAYGADVSVVTEPDPVTGGYLHARLKHVRKLLRETPNSYWPNQYTNSRNAEAHWTTMREIFQALGQVPEYVFCAMSTCGTIRGCAEYVQSQCLPTRIVAVDAVGSVISGGARNRRLLPGHGADLVPPLFRPNLAHHTLMMTDSECVIGCRRLLRREGILAGASSGAVIEGIRKFRDSMCPGTTCVAILPDRGERYLDTIYSDQWVAAHLGEENCLSHPDQVGDVAMASFG